MRLARILLLPLFLLSLSAVWAQNQATPAVDTATTPSASSETRGYDLGLQLHIYWLYVQMTFDSGNKWVYEKELSDCYSQLGDADKSQEELKASVTDNPNGVAAPAATVAKIRRHRKKSIQQAEANQPTAEPTEETTSAPTEEATAAPTEEATAAATDSTTPTDTTSSADSTPTPDTTPAAPVTLGSMTIGSYLGLWSVNYATPTNGTEVMFPVSASLNVASDIVVTASTNYLTGFYQFDGSNGTLNLANFSDTSLAAQWGFKTLDLDTVVSETFNLPTGNPSWTTQDSTADLPSNLIDPRYSAGDFSFSTVYGISVPVDSSTCSLGAGYVFNTDYNSNQGLPLEATDVLPGNSLFFNLNRVTPTGTGQSDTIQAAVYFSFPTLQNGLDITCAGPNLNLSYAWNDPTAFSFELGAQVFLPGETGVNGQLTPDPTYSSGPRVYLKPSYAIDDMTLAGQIKYVLPNGYDPSNLLYAEGGVLLSIGPNYTLKVDGQAFLSLTAAYSFADNLGGGFDANGNRVDVLYNWFNCSASRSFTF